MMVLSLSPILGNVKTGKLFALAVTSCQQPRSGHLFPHRDRCSGDHVGRRGGPFDLSQVGINAYCAKEGLFDHAQGENLKASFLEVRFYPSPAKFWIPPRVP
jgi:hypothetical protein